MNIMNDNENFRSGFVSIVGRPNVGKSTFLNNVVGTKIAAVSNKPNTTRNKILGIKNLEDTQIIFLDTPGMTEGKGVIGRSMVNVVMSSIYESDILLMLVDVKDAFTQSDKKIIEKSDKPMILLINKIDAYKKSRILKVIAQAQDYKDKFLDIIPVSALSSDGFDIVFEAIRSNLPSGPRYFSSEVITDQSERFIVSEIIREKIFELTHKEIPYRTAVVIDEFEENPDKKIINISATVYVERPNQKGIIIGDKGKLMKEIGTLARKDIEELLGVKVFLQIWVKVKDRWTSKEHLIKDFGYCN
jgi:GTP-binding protein Era